MNARTDEITPPPEITITITEDEYRQHCNDHDGVCLGCREFTCGGVEPDAEMYPCDCCGERKVYGTEQALLWGRLEIGE